MICERKPHNLHGSAGFLVGDPASRLTELGLQSVTGALAALIGQPLRGSHHPAVTLPALSGNPVAAAAQDLASCRGNCSIIASRGTHRHVGLDLPVSGKV
jgi:hypothetical protein